MKQTHNTQNHNNHLWIKLNVVLCGDWTHNIICFNHHTIRVVCVPKTWQGTKICNSEPRFCYTFFVPFRKNFVYKSTYTNRAIFSRKSSNQILIQHILSIWHGAHLSVVGLFRQVLEHIPFQTPQNERFHDTLGLRYLALFESWLIVLGFTFSLFRCFWLLIYLKLQIH